MNTGILGYGAYVPRRRLQRSAIHASNSWFAGGLKGLAKGEKAVANWDEDAITMAVEAARDCLPDEDRTNIDVVSLASTSAPFADRLNAGIVKEALNIPDETGAWDMTGSQKAGTSALITALSQNVRQVCLASERRIARPASEREMLQGDGAACILTGPGPAIANLVGTYSTTIDFIDHFRASGQEFDYAWESRWIRDEGYTKILGGAIKNGLAKLKIDPAKISHAVIAVPVRGIPELLARSCGISPDALQDTLTTSLGDTGVAHPLLMLVGALEIAKPGDLILVTSFGQGADVLVFEVTDRISAFKPRLGLKGHLAQRAEDTNYSRFLFHRGLLGLDRGMRAEHDEKQPATTLFRHRKEVLALVGGRCTKTGTVQFPKSDIGVSANDRSIGTQEDYPLAEKPARIVTYTADSLAYSPDPPGYYGMLDFEGGGRLFTEFTDIEGDEVEVGRSVRMMFRIKAQDERRHFTKYFWKAVPVAATQRET